MLTKSIKEVLWKTVLANGCFCFHKMKSPMPDGLSAALIQPLRVVAGSPTRRYADTAPFVVAAMPRCGLPCKYSLVSSKEQNGTLRLHADQKTLLELIGTDFHRLRIRYKLIHF
jgi:hypothetical protein